MHCENRAGKLEAAGREELWGGGRVGSVINIGHRVNDAALIAPGEKAASTACYCAESSTGRWRWRCGCARAPRHPIIAQNSCIWGGVVFLFFSILVLNLGRFRTRKGRERGARACTGGIGCRGGPRLEEPGGRWRSKSKIKITAAHALIYEYY
jgi:hypothetical protein